MKTLLLLLPLACQLSAVEFLRVVGAELTLIHRDADGQITNKVVFNR